MTSPAAPRAEIPGTGALLGADLAFMALVFLIGSDAFVFLGLNSPLWLACYGYLFLRIAISFPMMLRAIRWNWVFLLYPGLALASVLWSSQPRETLTFALQLCVTVLMAIFIGTRFSPRQIVLVLGGVLLLTMFASLVNWHGALTPAYDHRGNFKGIFLSKNALGHRSVLLSITCVFVLAILPAMRPLLRLLALAGLAAVALIVAISGSATAVLFSLAATLASLGLWLLFAWRGAWWSALALVALAVAALVAISGYENADPFTAVLRLLGRDATLTGRTVLWEFGWRHYLSHPLLGHGADAFWNDPRYANQVIALQNKYGDGVHGFHNLLIELLVMLGPPGLIAHGLMVATALRRTLWFARQRTDAYAAWGLVIVAANFGMALVGPQLYQPHAIAILLVVAIGAAFRMPQARARTLAQPRPGARPQTAPAAAGAA